jgi:hypothetical protein
MAKLIDLSQHRPRSRAFLFLGSLPDYQQTLRFMGAETVW